MSDRPSATTKEQLSVLVARCDALFSGPDALIPPNHKESLAAKREAKLSTEYSVASRIRTTASAAVVPSAVLLLTDAVGLANTQAAVSISEAPGSIVGITGGEKRRRMETESLVVAAKPVGVAAAAAVPRPRWHSPWELSTVIAGHVGWVRAIAIDPGNEYFATGSADRTIKIWDLAKCCAGAADGLRLTLPGHIDQVRALAISARHPYMFSAGDDKTVKCWDLETNTVIRNYHGHNSGVCSLALHPTLDILVTGGRDSVARVWDMRTKSEIHVLGGHQDAVGAIATSPVDPQIITGSYDTTIKLWDLAAGKAISTLTHHKKSVRSIVMSQKELTFASASADNIKKWQCRGGKFVRNLSGHNAVINTLAMNDDGVLFSGGDNGSMKFWDYDTGYNFQSTDTVAQPGSLESENGIYASAFDQSGSRLITCEADKSIKIWKESDTASEDSHPIDMQSWIKESLSRKKF
jgi:pleiotropic regulator 1